MLQSIPLDGPADLAALDDFLASDQAPPDCMQLSELDGFLTGIAIGPRPIMPSIWLPIIWHEGEPAFEGLEQAQTVLGIILRHYNEIIRRVDASPGAYKPVLTEQEDGTLEASDWTLGFLQAMSLCQDEWEPLVTDPLAGALIMPIMLIASTTDRANLELDDDDRLPDEEMAQLLAEAAPMLGLCVASIRAFFQSHRKVPKRKSRGRPTTKRRR